MEKSFDVESFNQKWLESDKFKRMFQGIGTKLISMEAETLTFAVTIDSRWTLPVEETAQTVAQQLRDADKRLKQVRFTRPALTTLTTAVRPGDLHE